MVEVRGVEPRSNRTLTVTSTCLADVRASLSSARRRASERQARSDNGLTGHWDRVVCFYDAACSGNRKPEGDTLTKLCSEGELHGGVLLRIFRVYFFFPFLRRRACGMLTPPRTDCRSRYTPTSRVRDAGKEIIAYYCRKSRKFTLCGVGESMSRKEKPVGKYRRAYRSCVMRNVKATLRFPRE